MAKLDSGDGFLTWFDLLSGGQMTPTEVLEAVGEVATISGTGMDSLEGSLTV